MKALIPFRRATDLPSLFPHEVDVLFDRFFPGFFGPGIYGPTNKEMVGKVWTPWVDVVEMEKELVVKVDLPGVDPKDVEVYIANGSLILKGIKKEEKEAKIANVYRMERFVGTFYREVPLPIGVNEEKITATTANGVLTVIIPKKPEVRPTKVAGKALV